MTVLDELVCNNKVNVLENGTHMVVYSRGSLQMEGVTYSRLLLYTRESCLYSVCKFVQCYMNGPPGVSPSLCTKCCTSLLHFTNMLNVTITFYYNPRSNFHFFHNSNLHFYQCKQYQKKTGVQCNYALLDNNTHLLLRCSHHVIS